MESGWCGSESRIWMERREKKRKKEGGRGEKKRKKTHSQKGESRPGRKARAGCSPTRPPGSQSAGGRWPALSDEFFCPFRKSPKGRLSYRSLCSGGKRCPALNPQWTLASTPGGVIWTPLVGYIIRNTFAPLVCYLIGWGSLADGRPHTPARWAASRANKPSLGTVSPASHRDTVFSTHRDLISGVVSVSHRPHHSSRRYRWRVVDCPLKTGTAD